VRPCWINRGSLDNEELVGIGRRESEILNDSAANLGEGVVGRIESNARRPSSFIIDVRVSDVADLVELAEVGRKYPDYSVRERHVRASFR